jgi:hypothetical protein
MSTLEASTPRIAVLNRDVFLGVRLTQLGHQLGCAVTIAPDTEAFLKLLESPEHVLGIIDINARPDWDVLAEGISGAPLPPILAFGPHLDVDALRLAKAAGVTRVVSNGTFHRDAAALITRYASLNGTSITPEAEDAPENH